MRAFIASDLPAESRARLIRLQQEWRRSRADVKWVDETNLHLTLRFLGEIDEEQRKRVERLLGELSKRFEPFKAALSEVGAFPSMSAPRVIWVGIGEGKERFLSIAQKLESALESIGFSREERSFTAHVTLGRVRSSGHRQDLARSLQEAAWSAEAPWPVNSLKLYQSVLTSAGPRYTMLAEFSLGGVKGAAFGAS